MKKYLLLFPCLLLFVFAEKSAGKDFPPLFPFLISYDGPDNASSMAHLLDGPAGKYGFIRVENGRFVNNKGPFRLHATNLTGPANFPSYRDAEQLAARLARFGINCVRLHYMDGAYGNFKYEKKPGIIADDILTHRNFSVSQLDRLDYMISALKKRGIYVDINLNVAHVWDERDGFTSRSPGRDSGLNNFEPRMIELQKEYARKLLTHVNPYTGLAYRDDPCVAMVELNNENGLLYEYRSGRIDLLPDPYASEFRKQWNEWLLRKYGSTEVLVQAWKWNKTSLHNEQITDREFNRPIDGKMFETDDLSFQSKGGFDLTKRIEDGTVPTIHAAGFAPVRVKQDFYQFIIDTERKYWVGLSDYLKKELKVKSVISGTQLGFSSPFTQAELDYVDNHAYWCHPNPVGPGWRIKNEPMVNSMAGMQGLAAQRVLGKPYVISEYNHPFPNQYGAEGQSMLCAYGRLQGWDGVFEYTYNQQLDFEPDCNTYFFSIIARTDVLAHFPACAAIFLRGDVQEAKDSVVARVNYTNYFDRLVASKTIVSTIGSDGHDLRQTLQHKTAVDLSGKKSAIRAAVEKISQNQKVFVSDTGELTWNTEQPGASYWTVNTKNTKLFTGFPKERAITLGNITLEIGKTRLGWTTISLVSRYGTGFGESGHPANILLAATGVSENKGMIIEKMSNEEITLKDWGKGPVYVEGIPAKVTLASDFQKTRCFALDPGGNRKIEIPVEKGGKGGSIIVIKPEYKTVWYEIEIR